MKQDIQRSFLDPDLLARLSRLEIHARGLVEGSFTGRHKSPHRGSSVEFSQYRKYVPGDEIRNVDWRVYARTDRFYIKEFEADTNLRCYLAVDCSGSMGFAATGGRSKLDFARQMAATLAHLLIKQGDAVGLQCFGQRLVHDIPPRTNPKHLHAMFDVLEDLQPEGETDLVTVLHDLAEKIRRRAMVIVFSDLFTDVEPLLSCFQHMVYRKHDLAVFHILDDQEMTFNISRPIRFVDMESNASVVTDPAVIRGEYMRCLDRYMAELKRGCREFNVDYRLAIPSAGAEKVLSEFLLDRMRRK